MSYLSIATFYGRWITLKSSVQTYIYDLHLIEPNSSSKQFALKRDEFTLLLRFILKTEFEQICMYDFTPSTLSRFLSFPENTPVRSWQLSLPLQF